jgi:hypothetical protein
VPLTAAQTLNSQLKRENIMKRNTCIVLAIMGLICGLIPEPAQAARKRTGVKPVPAPVVALAEAEANDLLFMREEEKLARDVYNTLYAEWNIRIFNKIAQSEQRHMDTVLGLLNKYGQLDPALEPGQFSNGELQELFNTLTAKGLQSSLDALRVGALIEEADIEDIVLAMQRTDKSDIISVYMNLLDGSKNHLSAFVKNIEAMTGETYVAQWISQEDVDEILGR